MFSARLSLCSAGCVQHDLFLTLSPRTTEKHVATLDCGVRGRPTRTAISEFHVAPILVEAARPRIDRTKSVRTLSCAHGASRTTRGHLPFDSLSKGYTVKLALPCGSPQGFSPCPRGAVGGRNRGRRVSTLAEMNRFGLAYADRASAKRPRQGRPQLKTPPCTCTSAS